MDFLRCFISERTKNKKNRFRQLNRIEKAVLTGILVLVDTRKKNF